MDLSLATTQMAANAERIRALVAKVDADQARWRPQPDAWSILEVVGHLLDEERCDFRAILDVLLLHPDTELPGVEHRRIAGHLEELLARFLAAREDSLAWLRTLEAPNWEAPYETWFGHFTAADICAAWVAHDLLHMRQLVELQWAYTTTVVLAPHRVDYAGPW